MTPKLHSSKTQTIHTKNVQSMESKEPDWEQKVRNWERKVRKAFFSMILCKSDSLSMIPWESNNALNADVKLQKLLSAIRMGINWLVCTRTILLHLVFVLSASGLCNMKHRNSLLILSKLRCLGNNCPQEQGLFLPKRAFLFWKGLFSSKERIFCVLKGSFLSWKESFLH